MTQTQSRPGVPNLPADANITAATSVRHDVEYRVQWRRVGWSVSTQTKSRTFAYERDARAFVAKLRNHAESGLSPAVVRVSWRPVGDWSEGWPR